MRVLILIRHAHRSTRNRELDNGLSAKGLKQQRHLTNYYRKHWAKEVKKLGEAPLLLSSSKKRCMETLQGIARLERQEIHEEPLLLEQSEGESWVAFRRRVRRWVRRWRSSKEKVTLLCSHGDWLPEAIQDAIGGRVLLEKGAWAEISQAEASAPLVLQSLIQEPR